MARTRAASGQGPGRRRVLLWGALAASGAAAIALAPDGGGPPPPTLSPREALSRVEAGRLTLVDIRRPDEWALTGVASGAVLLDMRRRDFETALATTLGGDRRRPVAVICARGVRSERLAQRMRGAGFDAVFDVAEGMLGSAAGPGWIARGLPLAPPPGTDPGRAS